MQGKGLIRFLIVGFLLVCLWSLLWTFLANRYDNKADALAQEAIAETEFASDAEKNAAFRNERREVIDSFSRTDLLDLGVAQYNYGDMNERKLKLGLDLQGGMYTVLEVSMKELISNLSNNSADPTLQKALENAHLAQQNVNQDFITLFGREYSALNPNGKLAANFASPDMKDISFNSTNAEVLDILRVKADEAVDVTHNILNARINEFGVAQPNIQKVQNSNRIVVELPGVDDPARIRKMLQSAAVLEFWETYNNAGNDGLINSMGIANTQILESLKKSNPARYLNGAAAPTTSKASRDDSGAIVLESGEKLNFKKGSFGDEFASYILNNGTAGKIFTINDLNFPSGSSVLPQAAKADLRSVSKLLSAYENVAIELGGHTDNVGNPASNQKLSQQRATSVMRFLKNNGVKNNQISAKGYGQTVPKFDNNTAEGKAKNRRTEVKVTSVDVSSSSVAASDSDASEDGSTSGLNLDADDTGGLAADDSTATDFDSDSFEKENPLYAVLTPAFYTDENTQRQLPRPGATVGYALRKDTAKVNKYMAMKEFSSAFPRNAKFAWGAIPIGDNKNTFELYALKSRGASGKPGMEGDIVTGAQKDTDSQTNQVVVNMQMNSRGAKDWKKLTGQNVGRQLAVVLDNKVYSAPNVNQEIAGGNTQISGQFSFQEAEDLANILKSGSLPTTPRIVEESVVGPTLGPKNIRRGLISLLAGVLAILLFMIFYYSSSGVIADLALLLNVFFIIGTLAAFGAVLTLPGIAGIVLTIGMAVDANVLIFERIREELARGLGLRAAIKEGYSKSLTAILDANVTTLITAIILAVFGMGPVLGFAVVLIIGIICSLITAILFTRLLTDWRVNRGGEIKYFTGLTEGAFKNLNIDFIGRRRMAYIVSGTIIGLGILSMLTQGFDLGVDFKGGRTYLVEFDQNVSSSEVQASLADAFDGQTPEVKTFGSADQLKITTSYKIDEDDTSIDQQVAEALYSGVKGFFKNPPGFDKFQTGSIQSSQKVGPTIADDVKRSSGRATIFALIMIFLYILIRFRKWQYGVAAIVTLAHDVLILLAIFSIFHKILPFSMEIDQAFIAALLTMIGYSINDTVVVFDRIREYLNTYTRKPLKETINDAINSTLSRTLITSVTTLIVVLLLFIFGGEQIRGFAFALLIGILVGTYSSIFIATPIVTDLTQPEKTRVVFAEREAQRANKKAKKLAKATK